MRKDGTEVWVFRSASLLRDEAGKPAYMIVQFQDITARREAEEQLRYNATHDELTGLLNRSAFEQKLEEALAESRDTGIKHALAFVDLDRLKIINDSAGHVAGDALLRGVAGALPSYLREGDVIGRLGGDEFGIILLGCSLDDATVILEDLNTAASAIQFPWDDRSYSVGASIGVTEITPTTRFPKCCPGSGGCCLPDGQDGRAESGQHLPTRAERSRRPSPRDRCRGRDQAGHRRGSVAAVCPKDRRVCGSDPGTV